MLSRAGPAAHPSSNPSTVKFQRRAPGRRCGRQAEVRADGRVSARVSRRPVSQISSGPRFFVHNRFIRQSFGTVPKPRDDCVLRARQRTHRRPLHRTRSKQRRVLNENNRADRLMSAYDSSCAHAASILSDGRTTPITWRAAFISRRTRWPSQDSGRPAGVRA